MKHHTHDHVRPRSTLRTHTGPPLSRRTLAKGTVWSAPVALAGVAAPAYAASTCEPGTVTLVKGSSPTSLQFSASTSATLKYSTTGWGADLTPGDTGKVFQTVYSPSWNYIKLHHPEGVDENDTITLTLEFNRPVTGLSMTLTDVDQYTRSWIDQVKVTPLPEEYSPGTNVRGVGSTVDPFRARSEGGIDDATGDVEMAWTTEPISAVTITYRAADATNGSTIGQHIGIGKFAITC